MVIAGRAGAIRSDQGPAVAEVQVKWFRPTTDDNGWKSIDWLSTQYKRRLQVWDQRTNVLRDEKGEKGELEAERVGLHAGNAVVFN